MTIMSGPNTDYTNLNRLKVVGVEAAAIQHVCRVSHRGRWRCHRRRRVAVGHVRCR